MLKAYDLGMTNDNFVFFTVQMLPEVFVPGSKEIWYGTDGRNAAAKKAFESVFHVSEYHT